MLCRLKQLEDRGEEDDLDLVDKAEFIIIISVIRFIFIDCLMLMLQATYKDRDWSNWKDANEKGSGNKIGKRI